MNDIRTLLKSLDPLLGNELTASIQWEYEKARAQGKILLPPPSYSIARGEYELGSVIWNEHPVAQFGLRENELPQHISIFGRTGAGKSNCTMLFVQQLIKKDKPFLIFDWKQTYRVLCNEEINLYTPGNSVAPFFFNPLDLRNIPEHYQEAYLRQLLSVLLNVYFRDLKLLSVEGVEYLLLRGFNHFRNEKNCFTFLDIYHWTINYKSGARENDWKSSALNVLYKLSTGPLGYTLNQKDGVDIQDISKRKTIIELHWLGSPKDKSFLMQILLLQIYYHFSQKESVNDTRYAIVIEEAHNVLLKHTEGYETVVEMILRQIREYGVCICLLDQHPSLMSLPALGTYCTIAFNLIAHEDVRVIASTLALEEDKDYLGKLRTGQAIVKLQDRYLKPFLVEFPKANIEIKSVCDSPDTAAILQEIPRIAEFSYPDKKTQQKENSKFIFLQDIMEYPLDPTTKRYQRLHLSMKRGNSLRTQLLSERLVHPIQIVDGKKRLGLFEITEAGRQLLREHGIAVEQSNRKGGLAHQYWCARVKVHYEQAGYTVHEEYPVGEGKAVDLVAIKGKEKIAIEIETGKSDVVCNVKKCLEAGFGKIIVIAISVPVKRYIENKMASTLANLKGISISTGSEFVK